MKPYRLGWLSIGIAVLLAAGFAAFLGFGRSTRDCALCPKLVLVPAGSFVMGSPPGEVGRHAATEGQQAEVAIANPLYFGTYEVTFAEWDACVAEGGCSYRASDRGWGRGNRPVIWMTIADAKEYLAWLSRKTNKRYRLPTEAEWEYAARAGSTTAYWWGDEVGANHANCIGCTGVNPTRTMPAGSFAPNKFGLFDTAGNVLELVDGCLAPSASNADCERIVARGGAWDETAARARSAARYGLRPDERSYSVGFRVVREP